MAETLKAVGEELAQMCLSDSAEWRHSGTRTAELLGFSLEILKSRPKVYQKIQQNWQRYVKAPKTSQVQDLILPPRGAAIPVRRGHSYSAVAFVNCRL